MSTIEDSWIRDYADSRAVAASVTAPMAMTLLIEADLRA
jgi:hypothetical protein